MKATFEQWSTALAYTESNNNPNAPLGDDGRAIGRWQMHLPFLYTWLISFLWHSEITVDKRCELALRHFYNAAAKKDIDDIDAACGFNKTGEPDSCKATDNPLYANRFEVWLIHIKAGTIATNSYD